MNAAERNALVTANMGIVWSIAIGLTTKRPWIERDDAVQDGVVALMKATENFDPSKGVSFATYAYHVINRRLRRLSEQRSIMSGMGQQCVVRGRPETEEARQLALRPTISLNAPSGSGLDNDSDERIDFLRSDLPDPEKTYADAELAHHARRLLAKLSPRNADIMRRRLAGESGEDVAADYGLTKQRVQQIERESIETLKADPWVRKTRATGGP